MKVKLVKQSICKFVLSGCMHLVDAWEVNWGRFIHSELYLRWIVQWSDQTTQGDSTIWIPLFGSDEVAKYCTAEKIRHVLYLPTTTINSELPCPYRYFFWRYGAGCLYLKAGNNLGRSADVVVLLLKLKNCDGRNCIAANVYSKSSQLLVTA